MKNTLKRLAAQLPIVAVVSIVSLGLAVHGTLAAAAAAVRRQIVLDTHLLIKPLKRHPAQLPNVSNVALGHAVHRKKISIPTHIFLDTNHLIKPLIKLQAQHAVVAVGPYVRHLIKPLKKLQAQHPNVAVGPCVRHLKKLQAQHPIVAVGPYARGRANLLLVVAFVEGLAFKEFIHLFGFFTVFRYLVLIRFHFPYP